MLSLRSSLKRRRHQRAFTLIEMVVAMAIVGITLMAGIPIFKGWSQNLQIRSTAEATLNGLQNARSEALRRNTNVRFELMSSADNSCAVSTGQTSWVINLGTSSTNDPSGACGAAISSTLNNYNVAKANCAPCLLQTFSATSSNVTVASTGTAASMLVVFDPLGRVIYPTTDTVWAFSYPSAGTCATPSTSGVNCMNIQLSANGRMRMCTTGMASNTPQGC